MRQPHQKAQEVAGRVQGVRIPLVVGLLFLAGCSAPTGQLDDPADPETPAPSVVTEAASFTLSAAAAQRCVAIVCDAGQAAGDAQRTELAFNRSLVAADLTFSTDQLLEEDTQVRITFSCDGIRTCDLDPVEVVGRPPLQLQAGFTDWPRGHAILMSAYLEGPAAGAYISVNGVDLQAAGTYTFEQDPAVNGPAGPNLQVVPLSAVGDAAICSTRGPGCGGSGLTFGPYDGVMEDIDLNVTWTSNSAQSEELVAETWCGEEVPGGTGRCEGKETLFFSGPSPLRIRIANAGFHTGAWFTISLSAPATAGVAVPGPVVPQPVDVTGRILLRPSAE